MLLDSGIIQEVNRRFFHILGLEMVAILDGRGKMTLRVRDETQTPGGLLFEHKEPQWSVVRQERSRDVEQRLSEAREVRTAMYGFSEQPIEFL